MPEKKILLVHGIGLMLKREKTILSRTNCMIMTVKSGKKALKVINKTHPDMVILDHQMPLMHGEDICRIVKSDPSLKDIVIIIVVNLGQDEDAKRCLEAGCDDLLKKPFSHADLLGMIQKHLYITSREHERFPIKAETKITIESKGTLQNISEDGVFIETSKVYPIGSIITINFLMPGSNIPVEAKSKVIRVSHEQGSFPSRIKKGIGIQFLDINKDAQKAIAEYLRLQISN